MGAVKGKPLLVEKNPQPLGVILRLEEELGKEKNIAILPHIMGNLGDIPIFPRAPGVLITTA